ncbi:uncharacterized protein N7482_003323 [Penicillium canariense]|uniref:Uncharacterized protein n=1 Tax=Penicillium canariense TaxID=189055 RepID=A0A9W9I4A2_9EURO|nr:uncharacterized protein N7482_003323 [Penicillium canariense]KAJ5167729.1 hypothetical protein N7482_003323 [Penicillium canariense]
MIDLDIRLREIVQHEAFLSKQCDESEDLLDDPKKRQQQLDEWHAEMRALEQEYWSVERRLYANDTLCPTKPSWRAYISTRKRPRWYLNTCSVRPKGDGHSEAVSAQYQRELCEVRDG